MVASLVRNNSQQGREHVAEGVQQSRVSGTGKEEASQRTRGRKVPQKSADVSITPSLVHRPSSFAPPFTFLTPRIPPFLPLTFSSPTHSFLTTLIYLTYNTHLYTLVLGQLFTLPNIPSAMAVPCTPPRHRRWAPGGLTVPAFLRNSHSDSQLNLRLTEDPATHIFALLRKHKLPESIYYTSTETESPKSLPLLPPSFLRHSETLLPSIGRCLAEAADVFAPQRRSPLVPGPSKDNTDKFAEYFEGVGERARLSTNAHRFFCRAMADSEFIVKFLLRPLNELMQCMLLPLGVQVFWRLTERDTSPTSRMELVWRQNQGETQSLAVLEVTTPQAVPDNEMLILLDYLRRGLVKIDKNGKFDVKSQVFFGGRGKPWSAAGSLAARVSKFPAVSDIRLSTP